MLTPVNAISESSSAVPPACLYEGQVYHKRFRPKLHSLRYSVFAFWLDPLQMMQLARDNKLLSYNRFNVFSIYDRDFGDGNLSGILNYLSDLLAPLGHVSELTDVRLLCYPRIFGYAFNPICVYYGYNVQGELVAVVYEVSNTFGETITYPFLVDCDRDLTPSPEGDTNRQLKSEARSVSFASLHGCTKEMHVSPFTPMDMGYQFRLQVPDADILLGIRLFDSEGTMLTASFAGNRQMISDARLLRNIVFYPLMTFKVTAGIHWEALKLWWKKIPWFPHTRITR